VGREYWATVRGWMKFPIAPESMKAWRGIGFSSCMVTGSRNGSPLVVRAELTAVCSLESINTCLGILGAARFEVSSRL
jgi:hypothetical protein